jgi:hypothetical protein
LEERQTRHIFVVIQRTAGFQSIHAPVDRSRRFNHSIGWLITTLGTYQCFFRLTTVTENCCRLSSFLFSFLFFVVLFLIPWQRPSKTLCFFFCFFFSRYTAIVYTRYFFWNILFPFCSRYYKIPVAISYWWRIEKKFSRFSFYVQKLFLGATDV